MKFIFSLLKENTAYAHCDIPCGIYDPNLAQLCAHTILRMTQLLSEIPQEDDLKSDHTIARVTHVKEEHADRLEEELSTLRDDYFKEEHFKEYANLNELFIKTLKSVSKVRQNIDAQEAQALLSQVLEIAEIFYKTKGLTPVRLKSIYPTNGEVVSYK